MIPSGHLEQEFFMSADDYRRPGGVACRRIAVFLLLALVMLAVVPLDAGAMPFFARRIGRDCTYCHTAVPKLNETGRVFRANGYRFAAEEEWQDAKDWKAVPVAVEAEVELAYNRFKAAGTRTESNDMKIEEVELFAGGPMGKSGRVSSLIGVAFSDNGSGVDTTLSKAFVQVNDLAGPSAEGYLNLRAGRWDIGLPFLNTLGSPAGNAYLADTALNVLTPSQNAVELNGLVVREGEDSSFAQRYSAGVSREDVYAGEKLAGLYATYSFTIDETYSLGAMFRTGREKLAAVDTSYNKYALAAEVDAEWAVFTAGFFKSDRNGAPERDDYVAELLIPFDKLAFGARYDYLKEHGSKGVRSQTLMVRYNILSNVYAQLEYRGLDDSAHVTGSNEDELKVRAFLTAIF